MTGERLFRPHSEVNADAEVSATRPSRIPEGVVEVTTPT